jgi:ABC-type cobalamin/Fe3+-siderophores transport system ATPase subunit
MGVDTAGAGKSTLLSVLFSLGPLNAGSVSIGGRDIKDVSCHEVCTYVDSLSVSAGDALQLLVFFDIPA